MTNSKELRRLASPHRLGARKTYHGRMGNPVIHTDEHGKKYIMVRARGGGVKRLYEGYTYYPEPTRKKGRKTKRILVL